MLFGKSKRKISHNLIISKYFEEESAKIQNQYFVRNVAEEFSIISLGFGDFFVMINPCSFDIVFDSDTFLNVGEVNLIEVEKFDAKSATVFRIFEQLEMPKLNIERLQTDLTDKQKRELKSYLKNSKEINKQYDIAMGELGTDLSSIKIDVEALSLANYKRVTARSGKQQLEFELAEKRKELASINEAIKQAKDIELTVDLATELRNMSDDEYEQIMRSISKSLDEVEVDFSQPTEAQSFDEEINFKIAEVTTASDSEIFESEFDELFSATALAELFPDDHDLTELFPDEPDQLTVDLKELSELLDSANDFLTPEDLFKDSL